MVTEEKKYRDHIALKTSAWAQLGTKVKKEAEELQALCTSLTEVNEVFMEDVVNMSTLCGFEATADKIRAVGQSFTCHVTWFACLTLYRFPDSGGQTEDAKKTGHKLESILLTWLEKDLPHIPPCPQLPKEHMERMVREMAHGVGIMLENSSSACVTS